MNKRKLVNTALAAIVSVGLTGGVAVTASAESHSNKPVKCYGVAKAGQNDCGVPGGHGCAGQAKTNYDTKEWKYLTPSKCKQMKQQVAAMKQKRGY